MKANSGRIFLNRRRDAQMRDDLKELLVLELASSYIRCYVLLVSPAARQESATLSVLVRKLGSDGTNNWM